MMSSTPSTSAASSASNTLAKELELKWSQSMPEGLKFFDEACHSVEDDAERLKVTEMVARKIRNASIFMRAQVFEQLTKTSIMCRIYLSHEFRSVQDPNFSRTEVFYEKSPLECTPFYVKPAHCLTKVFGNNFDCNLGVRNDGSYISEARIIKIPMSRKIEMSNNHSLFLGHDKKLYGCGQASLLTFDGKDRMNEYFEEPTLIEIPSGELVEDIYVENSGSLIVTDKYAYAIGSVCIQKPAKCFFMPISANCKRLELTKGRGQRSKIQRRENGVFLDVSNPNIMPGPPCLNRPDPPRCIKDGDITRFASPKKFSESLTEVVLRTSNQEVKIIICQYIEHLVYAFLPGRSDYNPCSLVLNGRLVENWNVKKHFTSPDGKIMMHLSNGILVKGRLEIVRLKNEQVSPLDEREPHVLINQNSCRVMAIVEEIPGSYGVETFCCSPDLESCIFQIGQIKKSRMQSYQKHLFKEKQQILIERFVEACEADGKPKETLYSMRETIDRITNQVIENCSTMKIWNSSPCAYAFDVLQKMTATCPLSWSRFKEADKIVQEYFVESMKAILFPGFKTDSDFLLSDVFDTVQKLTQTPAYKGAHGPDLFYYQYLGILALVTEKLLEEEIAAQAIEPEDEGKYNVRRPYRNSLKTQKIDEIVKSRVESGDLEPEDIPIDLKIIIFAGRDMLRYLVGKTNTIIFKLMYPKWANEIENGWLNLKDGWLHNYFFNRDDGLAVGERKRLSTRFREIEWQPVSSTNKHELMFKLLPKHQITDFVGQNTSAEDTYYLEALDGKQIPVHRLLFTLHSRRMLARQRFDLNKGTSETGNQKPTVIKTDVAVEVIENAIRALLDMTTLHDRNIDEAVAVLMFYDYHLMEEAFSDALDIILQMINDTNLDVLYWLFEKFEPLVAPYLLKHNRLILMSASEHIPSRDFIKRFSKLLTDHINKFPTNEDQKYTWPNPRHEITFDSEDIMQLMIDFSSDDDLKVLRAFANKWNISHENVMQRKMLFLMERAHKKRKNERYGERKSERDKKPRFG